MEFTRKPDNNETKLSLRRESLRELTTADLQQIAGGARGGDGTGTRTGGSYRSCTSA